MGRQPAIRFQDSVGAQAQTEVHTTLRAVRGCRASWQPGNCLPVLTNGSIACLSTLLQCRKLGSIIYRVERWLDLHRAQATRGAAAQTVNLTEMGHQHVCMRRDYDSGGKFCGAVIAICLSLRFANH